MIGVVKEICIFMIIAQAVLFFVPGSSYEKYVRILVGIIMIMRFMEPVVSLFTEEEIKQEIENQMALLNRQMEGINEIYGENAEGIKDSRTEIYESMEEEMKKQLAACESDYDIVSVKFAEDMAQGKGMDGEAKIIVTVSKEQPKTDVIYVEPVKVLESEREKTADESLRKMYANRLGIDAKRLEVILE